MSKPIIEVEGLSKMYRLGEIGATSLKLEVERLWNALRGRNGDRKTGEFWALRDISFKVQAGEVVGIIGRNGAGKSTLLKILSRITQQTSGEIVLRGRVASLLEVGTGFHPDLSGRENIYLNGAILGMTKPEIRSKFDEIVAFAEIDQFVETPVKRYSSGMYVRLAFAVAAHLEPEILIVDEVLAVGDDAFQKKCLGKMGQVAKAGRTVLFVSHNMNAILTLCGRVIVLNRGAVSFDGSSNKGVDVYGGSTEVSGILEISPAASKSDKVRLARICIRRGDGSNTGVVSPDDDICMDFDIKSAVTLREPQLSVAFTNCRGERIFAIGSYLGPRNLPHINGNARVTGRFKLPALLPGRYTLDVGFYDKNEGTIAELYAAGAIEVAECNYLQTTYPYFAAMGDILVRSQWDVTSASREKEEKRREPNGSVAADATLAS